MSDTSERGSGLIMLAFLGGAVMGALAGLLFAPRPGRETREKLKVLAQDAYKKARRATDPHDDVTRAA